MSGRHTSVRPRDSGSALKNPGMGWVFHHCDNSLEKYGAKLAPSDTLDDFPGLTVAYFRLPWSLLEPAEGKFAWSVVDARAQPWIEKGYRIALRFTCSETHFKYATPAWVKGAGAKGHWFNPGVGIVTRGVAWEPDFDDPVFLAKLEGFLAAAAARYDGEPTVAFVDVGSFGIWGEGQTSWSTKIPYSAATVRRHLEMHQDYFRRTLLAANDDFAAHGRGLETIDCARRAGMTLRDDSILVEREPRSYLSAGLASLFWPSTPVILECEHYGPSVERGAWGDGFGYLAAIEEYHASYASIHWWPREFLDANYELIGRINLRLGYRIQLLEASWPHEIAIGSSWGFASSWRNAGVAPCLKGGYPALTFKDGTGNVAAVFVDESFDVRDLPVDVPGQAPSRNQATTFMASADLSTGKYDVFVSVGSRAGFPEIALPLVDDDGFRRYYLGMVRITRAE